MRSGRFSQLSGLSVALTLSLALGCKSASFKAAGHSNTSGAAGGQASNGGDGNAEGTPGDSAAGSGNGTGSGNGSGSGGDNASGTPSPTTPPVLKVNGSTTDITVPPGTAVTVTWSGPNATSCLVQPLNASGTSGSQTVQANTTQAYTLACQSPGGPTSTTVNVVVAPPAAPTATLTANGSAGNITANPGDAIAIAWQSQNADTCTVNPGNGSGTSGTLSTTMATSPLVYALSCTGKGGSTQATVTINPPNQNPALTAQLKVNGTAVAVYVPYNATVDLSWTSTGATSCNLAPVNDSRLSGEITATAQLTASVIYMLTCKNATSSVVSAIAVNVGLPDAPVPDLKINGSDGPVVIAPGNAVDIKWSVTNLATSCTLRPNPQGATGVATSGEITTTATVTPTTYTLTCVGPGGQGTDSVAVMPVVSLPEVSITANGQAQVVTVAPGSMVDIVWSSQGASTCAVSPGAGTGLNGKQTVGPITSVQTYSAICIGPFGSGSATVTVVPSLPALGATLVVNGSTAPITVASGTQLTVAWASVEALSCAVSPFNWTGTAGVYTSSVVTANLTVTLTCHDGNGNVATAAVPVTVTPTNVWSTVSLKANGCGNPAYINSNSPPVQLVWTSTNTISCSFDDGAQVATSGHKLASVSNDTKFTVTCQTVAGGQISSSVWVKVRQSCKRSTKVGINFEDTPVGQRDSDFNDFTTCTDRGDFSIYGSEVVSERCQTIPFTTSRISSCAHHVHIEIHHPDGSQEKPVDFDDSKSLPTLSLHFKKGSTLEVTMTPIQSCAGMGVAHSMHDPVWAIVKPDECRRSGH